MKINQASGKEFANKLFANSYQDPDQGRVVFYRKESSDVLFSAMGGVVPARRRRGKGGGHNPSVIAGPLRSSVTRQSIKTRIERSLFIR